MSVPSPISPITSPIIMSVPSPIRDDWRWRGELSGTPTPWLAHFSMFIIIAPPSPLSLLGGNAHQKGQGSPR
eukprot:1195729-Prorocentrum_minimum.AAC.2